MSYYFIHSFSGCYPNAPDYQLLNYGAGRSMDGSYRDPGNMHAGSYGYKYNGMDSEHQRISHPPPPPPPPANLEWLGESSRVFSAQAALESRLREVFSCSLSCPESLPGTSSTSSGGCQRKPWRQDSWILPRQPVASVGAVRHVFAEIDETSVSSRTEDSGSQANSGAQVQTEPNATSTPAA
ncbi:LOW QUALITY PROTEIN: homeobox protein Hox-B5-like [Thamnophis elegans]|uniref:LOW QUALITY PROTEIN: homeobox protein Hox-B5-like n=1 Tax=Thamnophis elegans TaxID=35005 RepID=UPI001378EE4F|nr:LOW QUALITY PROTEIN: homeobox protein Hox-B5-like [Thamnophis elegans]